MASRTQTPPVDSESDWKDVPANGASSNSDGDWQDVPSSDAPASPAPSPQNRLAAGLSTLPQVGLSAGPKSSLAQFFQDAADDIKYGNQRTWVGKLFHGMGGTPTHNNVPPAIGDVMASPVLGPLQAGKGVGQVAQGHVLNGAGNIVGGALNTFTLPSLVGAGPAVSGAGKVASALLPDADRAAQLIETAETAAGHVPIDISGAGNAALRGQQIADSGSGGQKLFNDFVKRVTNPNKSPMTLSEARDFYKNATRLSADAASKMSGPMKAQVAKFTAELGDSIMDAAKTVGQDQNLSKSMDMYRRAMQNQARGEAAKKAAAKLAWDSVRVGAGTELAKAIWGSGQSSKK